MNAATAHHVAKAAGVSQITVSRAFSGKAPVAQQTRQRVLEAAQRMGYQPNPIALALRGAATGTLGILVSEVSGYNNLHGAELLGVLDRQCQEFNHRTLIGIDHADPGRLKSVLEQMAFHRVEGMVVFKSAIPAFGRHLESVLPADLPMVMIASSNIVDAPESPRTRLTVDRAAGVAMAVERAWELGHRHFAFVASKLRTNRTKGWGLKKTLRRLGGDWDASRVVEDAADPETVDRAVERLRAMRPQPTCVMCSNDYAAVLLIGRLQRLGFAVPEDVSVVGFDDAWVNSMSPVALTTIRQPRKAIAARAIRLLRQRINNPSLAASVEVIQPQLIMRDSLGPPPSDQAATDDKLLPPGT